MKQAYFLFALTLDIQKRKPQIQRTKSQQSQKVAGWTKANEVNDFDEKETVEQSNGVAKRGKKKNGEKNDEEGNGVNRRA